MFSGRFSPSLADLHFPCLALGSPASRDLTSPLSAALYVENRKIITKAVHTLHQSFPRVSSFGYNHEVEIPGDVLSSVEDLAAAFSLKDEQRKDESLSTSFRDLYNASRTTGTDQESQELRAFSDTLQDGYILCEYLNRLRSKRVTNPAKPDGYAVSLANGMEICLDNLGQFLSACANLGVPEEELFEIRDFMVAGNDGLARVAATIVAVSHHRKLKRRQSYTEVESSSRCFVPIIRQESLGHQASRLQLRHEPHQARSLDDTRQRISIMSQSAPLVQPDPLQVVMSLLSMILWNKDMYRRFLELRGQVAQLAIDAIQQIIDRRMHSREHKATFVTALLRLSLKSSLYPSCLVLTDIEREPFPCASGSFGDVYKGSLQGHPVCLKMVRVYKKSQIDYALKAFSREALVWRQTNHPNVLSFYGVYQLDEMYRRICLISPWMENGNIREYLLAKPQTNRPALARDVLRGLRYLHERSIVHGDLKGANILIAPGGRACLSDFGFSCISDPNILQWTSLESSVSAGGTVRWKAPELIDPEKDGTPTKESDIYAFGCVCYEIFTGVVPFHEAIHDYKVIVLIMQGKTPSKPQNDSDSFIHFGLTEVVWAAMEECWNPNPRERPTARSIARKFPRSSAHNGTNETRSKNETIKFNELRTLAAGDEGPESSGRLVDTLVEICTSSSHNT